jgi:hypothetical protein
MHRLGAWLLFGIALAVAASGAACAGGEQGQAPQARAMTGSGTVELAALPEPVAARYRFAEANRALMERIPCYCGCASLGHRSLYDCFLTPDGAYEAHGAGCGICQAEAVDVERLLGEGMSVAEIRAAIDATYGSAGPSTKTP